MAAEGGRDAGRGAAPAPSTVGAYRHTQFGTMIAVVTGAGLVAAALITLKLSRATLEAAPWAVVAMFAIIVAAFLLFVTLTVEVDARELRVRFGIGVFRRTIALADVRRCEVVRTRVWWGWGLHWTPSGWLYNVAGRDAVRIELAREKAVMIGSDEALALKQAIELRRAAAPQATGG